MIPRGATGSRLAARAPRSRAADGLFADFAAAKQRAATIAAAERTAINRADSTRAAMLADSAARFTRQRDSILARQSTFSSRLTSFGQPGAGRVALGGAGDAAGTAAGGAATAAAAGFERVRATASAAGGSMASFARDAASVATGLVAAELGLGGLSMAYTHLKDSVMKAADFEMQRVGFEVLLRSADDASSMLADIRRYAAQTPFSVREVTDASRQLLAYGFAAERVMPTIRMLGDVSAAMPDRLPLGDAAYLFGTLRSQGRAYTRDLVQFSNRGVSINEELAGVLGKGVHEVQALTEEGRVGFRDVERAFQRMTSEGGRFFGMTARQGQTAAASFEQLGDAVDQLKASLGQVLIEELDLRGASRDLQAFAGRMRDATGEARPFVRTVGEVARGAANVGSEFAKAGFELGRIGFDSLATAHPQLRLLRDEVGKLVEDARAFKLDERQVVRTGFALGGALVEGTSDAARMAGQYGDAMTRTFELIVRASRQARDFMAESAAWVNRINDALPAGSRFLVRPLALTLNDVAGQLLARNQDALRGRNPGDALNRFAIEPPVFGMDAARVREEWPAMALAASELQLQINREQRDVDAGRLRPFFLEQTQGRLADVRRRQDAYAAAFEGDPADVRRHLAGGNVPQIRRGPAPPPDVLTDLERDLARLRTNVFEPLTRLDIKKFRDDWNARLDARLSEVDRREAAAAMAGDRSAAFAAGIGPASAVPLVPPDARVLVSEANRRAAWGALVGPMAAVGSVPDRLEPPRPEAMELGVRLRREYDPRVELEAFKRDLDGVRLHMLAGPGSGAIADRAWRAKVQEVGQRFGVGRTVELPPSVEAGSAEDARLINMWRSQPQQSTTDQLLQQLVTLAQRSLQLEASRPQAPPPRVSGLPGD
ncbi:MAG: tape measure protein [Gemmataceae bacterium]